MHTNWRIMQHVYLRSYPYGYCCLWPICMLPIGPGGPLLYCSPIPLFGPGCMNCSPAEQNRKARFIVGFTSNTTPTASNLSVAHLSSCHQRGPCWTRRDPSDSSSQGRPSQAGNPASSESWHSFWKMLDLHHQQMGPAD